MMNKLIVMSDYILRGTLMALAICLLQRYLGDSFIIFTAISIMIFNFLAMFFDKNYKKER